MLQKKKYIENCLNLNLKRKKGSENESKYCKL